MRELNYIEVNKKSWNKATEAHINSELYNNNDFKNTQNSLNEIELDLIREKIGDLSGKSILHLQCHFGQDTISLGKLGGEVTGVDFSDKSIKAAQELASELGSSANFINCNVYDLPEHLDEKFDIVFTSYGTIGWLEDLGKWAEIVSTFLKDGGKFIFVEFHPVVWMFDNDFKEITYRYSGGEPIVETNVGSYADSSEIEYKHISFNHGLEQVINNLIGQGLTIESFKEYDYSPYNCFKNTVEVGEGKYRIEHLGDKIPMVYSIVAGK